MLPSLRGLQALSVLSQTGSLTTAADILGVSRSALSHRIADLEHQLGVGLIQKRGRRVAPTDDAEALLSVMGDALDRIEAAVEPIRRRRSQLRISTVATLASHWLLPRLPEFRALHPDIEVALTTTRRVIDLEAEDIDCAIRYGLGRWSGLTAALLFRETLAPVAAPIADQNLDGSSIIRARSRFRDWSLWWTASRRAGKPSDGGLVVESRAQALEAALAGGGIAMIDMAYLEAHLSSGRLRLLAPPVTLDEGYYLVRRPVGRNDRLVSAFEDWILAASEQPRSEARRVKALSTQGPAPTGSGRNGKHTPM
ncbi:LysR substrate-binding domain-containing protein [Bradyrhizobium sp. LTSP857]|uniref:LysR substrate-binding domain-containing protein n=1 Tax=Bradyrhizobium sp. LTSP857 TaxID=1619231 RepID=UPI0007C82578|nr:LysR substrate-binding domain-containing protein [Bradyrhizobium sp. LTSP857]